MRAVYGILVNLFSIFYGEKVHVMINQIYIKPNCINRASFIYKEEKLYQILDINYTTTNLHKIINFIENIFGHIEDVKQFYSSIICTICDIDKVTYMDKEEGVLILGQLTINRLLKIRQFDIKVIKLLIDYILPLALLVDCVNRSFFDTELGDLH